MTELYKKVTLSQLEAALSMLRECIALCPDEHWDTPVAKYPFWQVAYHTLCFLDLYLRPTEAEFQLRPEIHPAGMAELEDEYPSRRFSRDELLRYADFCLDLLRSIFARETTESLAGPTGHPRLRFTRAELHLYSLRHVQHHAGQLGALLRRVGVDTRWTGAGWR